MFNVWVSKFSKLLKLVGYKTLAIMSVLALIVFSPSQYAYATEPKLGARCTKLNQVTLSKNVILMCMSSAKGWTWQSMGSTTTTPTKQAQTLPLVLNMTRKEAAAINTYLGCLHRNGLEKIKTLSDIWNIDPNDSVSKNALNNCVDIRPTSADKPANKFIPAQESSTRREIRIIILGNNPIVQSGNTFQCTTGTGNFSIKWGISIKPLYPSLLATTDNSTQSLAYFKSTQVDFSTIRIDQFSSLSFGKYLTCIVADPAGSTYLGSSSVLIPKTS